MFNKIVFIVGMTGSGKSAVSDELVKKGFEFVRFGQITLDKAAEEGDVSEANEKKIRERIRAEHGMAAFATLNIPKFDKLLEEGNVVGDGLYSWSEYKVLKEKYGDNMYVIAIYAPPKVRYERLEDRAIENDSKNRWRATTKEESKSRDYAEIENIEKGGPIAMADYTIINTGTLEELKKELNRILSEIDDQD
ncbi:AAA family ATPase [Patescibacteria group bacterium]|nr:AAA family ATPase [Patescibacteria group bacterium]